LKLKINEQQPDTFSNSMNKIEIPLGKTKLLLGIGGSLLFIVAGYFLFTTLAYKQTILNPSFVKAAGVAGILFFGATGIYGIRKLFDKSIGLIIDENGIFDNTNASSIGLIKWSDITGIEVKQVQSTRFLLVYAINPEDYMNKAKGIKRKLMVANNKFYGTPLSITSNTLKCSFDELENLIRQNLKGKS